MMSSNLFLRESSMTQSSFQSPFSQFLSIVCVTIVFGLSSSTAQAQVEFNFNYTDVNTGFNDASQGAQRRAALEASADIVEGLFSNYTATINIDVNGSVTNNSFLASAGSNYNSAFPGAGFGDRGDVMTKILGGADPNSGAADGVVNWNFEDFNWEYGTDFQAGEFDFVSTAVHEIMHTVGFLSGIRQDGTDLWGNSVNDPGTWEPFDEFVADNSGALIDGSTFINDKTRWDAASVGGTGSNGLFFIGANAMAANGGNPVNLYSPSTWEDGSSGAHLDDNQYGGLYVMESSTGTGLGVRGFSDIERGMLRDIGYTNLTAVPEPTGMLVLCSLGIYGLCRRRR
jgi:hypothetical protein